MGYIENAEFSVDIKMGLKLGSQTEKRNDCTGIRKRVFTTRGDY